jgi:predicted KAP-like P-loop ATPase
MDLNWRREKRICSKDVFNKYFILGVPEGEISEAEIINAIQRTNDEKEFIKILQDFNKRGLARRFLERMGDFVKDFPVENVKSTINALLSIGDELPVDSHGIFTLNAQKHIAWIICQILQRIEDLPKRAEIIKDPMGKCSGLYTIIITASWIESSLKEEAPIILMSEFEDIKTIILTRIRQEAKESMLADRPDLSLILYHWKDWSKIDEPRAYISQLVESGDKGIIKLLVGFLNEHYLSTGRKWVIDKAELEWLSAYINLDELADKAKNIELDTLQTLSDKEKLALDCFLKNFEALKPKEEQIEAPHD